jgi:hypothetical protein
MASRRSLLFLALLTCFLGIVLWNPTSELKSKLRLFEFPVNHLSPHVLRSDCFSMLVLSYRRTAHLTQFLRHYLPMQHLCAIYVIDNNLDTTESERVAAALSAPQLHNYSEVTLFHVIEEQNLMTNRLKPRVFASEALFICDDDVFVNLLDVEFAFEQFRDSGVAQRRMVGFLPRAVVQIPGSLKYATTGLDDYSVILLGASFIDAAWLPLYAAQKTLASSSGPIDAACDDLSFSFFVSNMTRLPPLHVLAAVRFADSAGGLSRPGGKFGQFSAWRTKRVACLERLRNEFGSFVLPATSEVRMSMKSPYYDAAIVHAPTQYGGAELVASRDAPVPLDGVVSDLTVEHNATVFEGGCLRLQAKNPLLAFRTGSSWTLAAWVRPNADDVPQTVVAVHASCGFGAELFISTRRVLLRCANAILEGDAQELGLDEWVHVAGVFSGARCSLFVNGRLSSAMRVRPPPEVLAAAVVITVGALTCPRPPLSRHIETRGMLGSALQGVHVWTRAMTGAELEKTAIEGPSVARLLVSLPLGGDMRDATGTFHVRPRGRLATTVGPPSISSGLRSSSDPSQPSLLLNPLESERVTAVLVSFARPANIATLVARLATHARVAEIIVWDNSIESPLERSVLVAAAAAAQESGAAVGVRSFTTTTPVSVRVMRGSTNVFTEGRYRACAASSLGVCMFLDDDFLPPDIDALWASYAASPALLHVATDLDTARINAAWTYSNATLGLHTGFAWVGAGAMTSRDSVSKFLAQMDAEMLGDDERRLADVFFSLWRNELPVQMICQLNQSGLDTSHAHNCATCTDHRTANVVAMRSAILRLTSGLASGRSHFVRSGGEHFAYSPVGLCSNGPGRYNERTSNVFFARLWTNSSSSWSPTPEGFNVDDDLLARTERPRRPPAAVPALDLARACDGDNRTAWVPAGGLRRGDYFGLRFPRPMHVSRVIVQWATVPDHAHWALEVAEDAASQLWDYAACAKVTLNKTVTFRCKQVNAASIRVVYLSGCAVCSSTPRCSAARFALSDIRVIGRAVSEAEADAAGVDIRDMMRVPTPSVRSWHATRVVPAPFPGAGGSLSVHHNVLVGACCAFHTLHTSSHGEQCETHLEHAEDIVFATHLSSNRFFQIQRIVLRWRGCVSVAVSAESQDEIRAVERDWDALPPIQKSLITVHFVLGSTAGLYPVNVLRNVATEVLVEGTAARALWRAQSRPWMLIADGDTLPSAPASELRGALSAATAGAGEDCDPAPTLPPMCAAEYGGVAPWAMSAEGTAAVLNRSHCARRYLMNETIFAVASFDTEPEHVSALLQGSLSLHEAHSRLRCALGTTVWHQTTHYNEACEFAIALLILVYVLFSTSSFSLVQI